MQSSLEPEWPSVTTMVPTPQKLDLYLQGTVIVSAGYSKSTATDSVTATGPTIQVVCQSVVLIHFGFVVACMTACTGGRIPWRRPGDDFSVGPVAIRTCRGAAMIERFVGQSRVAVVGRCPRVCVVTQVALLRRIEVTRILARCRRAVVT